MVIKLSPSIVNAKAQCHKTSSTSFVLVQQKHPIRTPYQITTVTWLDDFGVRVENLYSKFYDLETWPYGHKKNLSRSFDLILQKHPIRTPYQINTTFWLDSFGVQVWNLYIVLESFLNMKLGLFIHIPQ